MSLSSHANRALDGPLSGNSPAASQFAPRLAAGLLACAAAVSLTYWGLQITASSSTAQVNVTPPARIADAAAPEQVARLLAAPSAPSSRADANAAAPSAGRFQLTGVAAGVSGRGVAIISVEGRPPRPFTVGLPVAEGLTLQSVQGRRAQLGPDPKGPATVVLELPPLAR